MVGTRPDGSDPSAGAETVSFAKKIVRCKICIIFNILRLKNWLTVYKRQQFMKIVEMPCVR